MLKNKLLTILCLSVLLLSACSRQKPESGIKTNVLGITVIPSATPTGSLPTPSPEPIREEKYVLEYKNIKELPYEDSDDIKANILKTKEEITELDISMSFDYSATSMEANTKIYSLCSELFTPTLFGQQLSPLIPMAISNNETPGRCDPRITFCALFPSRVVKISSSDIIEDFNILYLLQDKELFKTLGSEYSTRDRGALQMSPTYGANASWLGPSEKELLATVDESLTRDLFSYQFKDNTRLTFKQWEAKATDYGDRFNIHDVLLRLNAAFSNACAQIEKSYFVVNEYQPVAMMALYHQSSGVWSPSVKDKAIGNWVSGQRAYQYSLDVTKPEVIDIIKRKVYTNLAYARKRGYAPVVTVSNSEVDEIWLEAQSKGYIANYDYYVNKINLYGVTYRYPIRTLYNYILLELLYNGE